MMRDEVAAARVQAEPWRDGIAVWLLSGPPGHRLIHRPGPQGNTTELIEGEGEALPVPSLRLDDTMAEALLDALARHYGRTATTDTLAVLRRDYLDERGRVDRLIGALTAAHQASVVAEGQRLAALGVELQRITQ